MGTRGGSVGISRGLVRVKERETGEKEDAIFNCGGGFVFVAAREILPGPPVVFDILLLPKAKLCHELPVVDNGSTFC